jgi:multidrug efflux pump subunit AcrB
MAVELPPGTRLEDTTRTVDDITKRLRERPEIKSVFVDGGRVGLGAPEVRKATLVITLVHKSKRQITQREVRNVIGRIVADVPDTRTWFLDENGQRQLTLGVQGADTAQIERVASELASQMKRLSLITNVTTTAALDRPEIRIRPRTDRASELGVSTDALAEAIRIATLGDIDANLAKFNAGDRLVPMRVALPRSSRGDLDTLGNLRVTTSRGASVPLSSVADIEFGQGPATISRFDRQRRVAVEADLATTDALGEALDAVYALPAAKDLPPGIRFTESGDAEVMGEVFQGFAQAMGAGLMMVLAVLILLFGSVLQPITILLSLPLSIGGVIGGLLIMNYAISMPVVIGILMLMGIVTKNAIMLVDFAVERIAVGVPRTEALVDAGRKRARPIVMTTIAMGAGMIPSALGVGDGGEFRSPMAVGVIGGLIASTILSLVFVPAMFTVMDDLGRLIWRGFARFVGPRDEEPAVAQPHGGAPNK